MAFRNSITLKIVATFLLFQFEQNISAQSTYTLDSTVVTSRVVKDLLDIPWEITWGPDDYIWTTERFGRVSRINPTTGQQHVLLNISSLVYANSESGLLGMVLHPNFTTSPYVYLVYTYLSGTNIRERIVRYTYDGTALISPFTLLQNIIGNTTHIGSRLFILPDTTMLASTGDAQNQSLPQDTSSVVGKILRMNLDGSVPTNNPFPNSLVWSFGHRNAQGIWLAPNGILYSSEHGPTTDDELNILKPSRNYGWPTVTGYCDSPPEIAFCNANNVVEPIAAWTPTIAPSDIIWYSHPAIPEFKNRLLMTVLKDKKLIAFSFNNAGDTVTKQSHYLTNAFGRLRDICISPSGKIYVATNGESWSNTNPYTHKIIELSNNSYNPTSVNAPQKKSRISVYPNPIAGNQKLTIELPENASGVVTFYNLLGQTVFSSAVSNLKNQFNLNIKPGIYVWVTDLKENGTTTDKIVITE